MGTMWTSVSRPGVKLFGLWVQCDMGWARTAEREAGRDTLASALDADMRPPSFASAVATSKITKVFRVLR
jgi:hypothetical protein